MPRLTITVPGKNPQPYRFQLDRQAIRLGRGSENDIVIDCPSVSVLHAELERIHGGYQLRDLDSTNGTKLDGERQHLIAMRNGLAIRLGDVDLEFQLNPEEQETLTRERPGDPRRAREHHGDDSELPHRAPRPRIEDLDTAHQPGALKSFFTTLFLIALALAAFIAGMEFHHRRATATPASPGRSLIRELANGPYNPQSPPTTPENPAPAGTE
jgi:pSer/pThr/pTyr-binding forkhead associated (FHA) protein